MKWLKPYMPEYLRQAAPAWASLLGEVLVDLSMPTLMAAIINRGVMQGDLGVIRNLGLMMLGLAAVGAALGLARSWSSTWCSQNLGTRLRADLFRKTQRLSMAGLRAIGPSTLITRLTSDVMQVQNLSFMITRIFIRAPLMLLGGMVMATLLNARMALILVVIMPLMSLLLYVRIKRGFPLFRKVQTALDRVNGVLREYLAGVREVKVFNRTDYEAERYRNVSGDLADLGITAARSMATIQPLIFILMNGSIIALLWFGGQLRNSGQTEVGDIVAFIQYFLMILQAMYMMSMIFTAGVRAKTSLDRLGELFALPEGLGTAPPVTTEPARRGGAGAIAMRDVRYTTPGQSQPIVESISFDIASGQTVAIVGSTGSGKSTLINLICRFFDPDQGAIWVCGRDVRSIPVAELRGQIGLVQQQSLLFTGTLRDNLRWGRADATDEEIREAIRIAQAAEFIERMPDGLDSWIGQGGVNLSGGQKQRVCIARALIRGAPILIFDDSFSAIDLETERQLRSALKENLAGTTLLIVAQRIQSVVDADQILVLDAGRIESAGRHRDLLENSPVYRDIYRSQFGLDAGGREVV